MNRRSLTGTDPAGEASAVGEVRADIMPRDSDGHWLILIDDPGD